MFSEEGGVGTTSTEGDLRAVDFGRAAPRRVPFEADFRADLTVALRIGRLAEPFADRVADAFLRRCPVRFDFAVPFRLAIVLSFRTLTVFV
jgi:hypothetical protein